MEEETKYGVEGEAIANNVLLVTTSLYHAKMAMERHFGYCFVTNQSML
jgi:hypothetical protein